MTYIRFSRRQCLAAGLFASVPWPGASIAQASRNAGVVQTLAGRAQAELETIVRQLSPNDRVFVGDRVSTGAGARASILLGQATELRLGAEARIRIDRFLMNAGGVINLETGAMRFERDPEREQGSLTVRSAYGLIGVRGTRFFAGPSNGVFGVFVERGAVSVSGGGQQVVVNAGEGTDIARPGARPTQPKAWGAERIRLALSLVS